ncbi:MAG: protoporphyrin/coproporphyrin ferrochelatase [Actinomycetota bacterium]|jgi:ferrochelatase
MTGTTGVLVMAYGTPATPDDVEAYYTDIRRGRPPTPEQVAELRSRYDAIGGISPLLERTRDQAAALQAALGDDYRVALGQKHAVPTIEEARAELDALGVDRIVGLVLAPHYSALSVGQYEERARPDVMLRSWHLEDGLVELLAERVGDAGVDGDTEVLFTAHSLPARVLEIGDPYPDQVRETAEAVARRAGVARWRVAWQSAGRTPEPWLGPDILEVIPTLDAAHVVVCPIGFTSDHLEVLYDVDIEARRVAEETGKDLTRTESLNDDPRFIAVLADLVRRQ